MNLAKLHQSLPKCPTCFFVDAASKVTLEVKGHQAANQSMSLAHSVFCRYSHWGITLWSRLPYSCTRLPTISNASCETTFHRLSQDESPPHSQGNSERRRAPWSRSFSVAGLAGSAKCLLPGLLPQVNDMRDFPTAWSQIATEIGVLRGSVMTFFKYIF